MEGKKEQEIKMSADEAMKEALAILDKLEKKVCTLDPSANIIDVYIWMLFDDVGPGIL